MTHKSLPGIIHFVAAFSLILLSSCNAADGKQTFVEQTNVGVNNAAVTIGTLYEQPVDPNGKLLPSSWLDPDGSDFDQYIWDNFTLQSNETIIEIQWFGVYDPLKFGAGGPVLDFSVSIFPSIAAGTEPAVANPPLVQYQTGGNAGETSIGTAGGATLYAYAFSLPTPFAASAGVKYWIQIEASQQGSTPDWCLAAGFGGDGSHYQKGAGAGGDVLYRFAPGDAAFVLLGPIPATATPTDTPTYTPTQTGTATPTATDTPTSTATDTPTATQTATDTSTATSTATDTATPTRTETATQVFTDTPTNTPTDTPTGTPIATEPPTPTDTPSSTPTPTPIMSMPGRITGGGTIDLGQNGSRISFGLTVHYDQGDPAPNGNLTFHDHTSNLRLRATSFDLLVIEGDHAWFTGIGIMNDEQVVRFTVEIDARSQPGLADTFSISIPALNGYTAGGAMTGGNITIHR